MKRERLGYNYSSKENLLAKRGDKMLTSTMKDDLIRGLVDIFSNNIIAIILYGSVARNENTAERDMDIEIIVKNEM